MQSVERTPYVGTQLPTSAAFEPLACVLLEPCVKDSADKATKIRRRLKADLGRWQAEAVLSLYNEVCLRHKGVCSRYFTNKNGTTLRLRTPENHASYTRYATPAVCA